MAGAGSPRRHLWTGPGRARMRLCDGMGTGKPAAVDGQMAAKRTAQLLQAGFAAESAARLVNVALGLKNAGQESGATLDLLTLDLHAVLAARLDVAAAVAGAEEEGADDEVEASGPLTLAIDLDEGAAGAEAAASPA